MRESLVFERLRLRGRLGEAELDHQGQLVEEVVVGRDPAVLVEVEDLDAPRREPAAARRHGPHGSVVGTVHLEHAHDNVSSVDDLNDIDLAVRRGSAPVAHPAFDLVPRSERHAAGVVCHREGVGVATHLSIEVPPVVRLDLRESHFGVLRGHGPPPWSRTCRPSHRTPREMRTHRSRRKRLSGLTPRGYCVSSPTIDSGSSKTAKRPGSPKPVISATRSPSTLRAMSPEKRYPPEPRSHS